MSTTNPSSTGGYGGGHGEEAPLGASADAIKAGHEPDAFTVKPIMSIPIAVVVTFVVAFSVAAGVFAFMMNRASYTSPQAHPDGVARGSAKLTERLERIDRAGSNGNKSREVDQPRLEPLKRLANDGRFTTQLELPTGNSPQIHPEEIFPDRVAALQRAEYHPHDKKLARIPIADAMEIAVKNGFPYNKANSSAPTMTADKPSTSNGGNGVVPVAPKPAAKPEVAPIPPGPKPPEQPKPPEPPKGPTPKAPEPAPKAPEPPKTPEPPKASTPEKK